MKQEIYRINDLSRIINRTPKAIRIAMCRGEEGKSIPPSIKLGGRRVWLRASVEKWIANLE